MDKLNFHKQKRGVTASTGSADLNQIQTHAEEAVNNAIADTFPVPACLSAGDMAVTSNGDWTVHVSAGVGYDEYGARVVKDAAEDIDLGPTAYANPAAGNEYYLRVVAVHDVTETDPRVDGDGVGYNFHLADGCAIEARKGVEAPIGAAAVPAAEAGDITLAVVRRFAGQVNIGVADISTALRDEQKNFIRQGDTANVDDLNVADDAVIAGDLTVTGAIHGTADEATNLAGGLIGQVPYQADAGHTDFLASVAGDAGRPLCSGGAGAPSWGQGFLKKIGDTGWLEKVAGSGWQFDFDENAGSLPPVIMVYIADDTSATNMAIASDFFGPGGGEYDGIQVKNITATGCRIQLGANNPFYGLTDVGTGVLDGGLTAPVYVRAIAFKIIA
jgi:hypothetical protein